MEVIASSAGLQPGTASITLTRPSAASSPSIPAASPSPTKVVSAPPPSETWPAATSAWTVVLASDSDRSEAEAAATSATHAGLSEAGVLYSSSHASLRPGYWVAYTGVLSHEAAAARQQQARTAGFPTAYARYVSAAPG